MYSIKTNILPRMHYDKPKKYNNKPKQRYDAIYEYYLETQRVQLKKSKIKKGKVNKIINIIDSHFLLFVYLTFFPCMKY